MRKARRILLQALLLPALALVPLRLLAAVWNRAAFEARDLATALREAGVGEPARSEDIVIRAPEIAENGAQVPVEIQSRLVGTELIQLFVERNPQPLAASFRFLGGTEAFISTRIKMGETSELRVVVTAAGRTWFNSREVKVTIGGCGV